MNSRDAEAVRELIETVIATFRQFRVSSSAIHGDGTPIPGQRGVLVGLAAGEQTVADMARARGVSRQHIQTLVDRFRDRGLVAFSTNPRHRRSKLVVLTAKGRAEVDAMLRRENTVLRSMSAPGSAAEIRHAVAVLRRVAGQFEAHFATPGKGRARKRAVRR